MKAQYAFRAPRSAISTDAVLFLITIFILVFALQPSANGQAPSNQYWDGNGSAAGASANPSGTWDTGITAFWNGSDGTGTPSVWTAGNNAFFSAGTDATGDYTVTVSGPVVANAITVEEGRPTFAGTLVPSLRVAAGITVNSGAGPVFFGSSLPIAISANQSWTNSSANLLSFAGPISSSALSDVQTLTFTGTGAGGTDVSGTISDGESGGTVALTKLQSGKLTLSGPNTYSGGTTWGTSSAAGIIALGNSSVGGPGAITSGPLGTGTFTVSNSGTFANGHYIQSTDSTTRTVSNTIHITGGGINFNTGGSGDLIFDGSVSIGAATRTFSINNTNTTFSGVISGGGNQGIIKEGPGTMILSGASTYSGATTIDAGTVRVDNNNTTTARLANTSGITINNGGTLLLSQTGQASTDRINNNASVTIAGGGKLSTGGLTEGTAPVPSTSTNGAVGMGALTLSSTAGSYSIIDFADAANGSALVFSGLSNTTATYVDILNWTGTERIDSGAPGNDRLLFSSSTNLTETNLANWRWYTDGSSTAFMTGATMIPYGDMFEVVPVPEPSTWAAGALALAAAGFMSRRRLKLRNS